jgi:hypothetical protein
VAFIIFAGLILVFAGVVGNSLRLLLHLLPSQSVNAAILCLDKMIL